MHLVERAKNIILTPKSEWDAIGQEIGSATELYKSFIAPLAAIGPISLFIGNSLIGFNIPFLGSSHTPLLAGLSTALLSFVFALVGVYLVALLISALAPNFGGEKNQWQALKITAYSHTPAWIAGVLHILPGLGLLVLLASLYSLYLLWLGLPILMKTPQEKAGRYTVTIIVSAILISVILGAAAQALGGFGLWERTPDTVTSNSAVSGAGGALNQWAANMDDANKKLEAANQSGNPQQQAEAMGAAMGALLAGGSKPVDSVDQNQLKALFPDTLASLKRNQLEAEKVEMGGFKISKANASYGDDQGRSVELTITDAGGTPILGVLTAWSMIEQEKTDDNGYEKIGKVDGRPVQEKFNTKSLDGEYRVVVANRFVVEGLGQNVDMDTLKQTIVALNLDKLEALKDVGVKP